MLYSILHIIGRNVGETSTKNNSSKIQKIINFIHVQIYNTEQFSNKALASEFNIAEKYISQYLKKQVGISLKKYILNYKIKPDEKRLKNTDLNLLEIAIELGFTDSSHLIKLFCRIKE